MADAADQSDVEKRILAYLRAHPRAMDTAAGIALFWVDADLRQVERALETLVSRGQVVTRERAGRLYYQAPQPDGARAGGTEPAPGDGAEAVRPCEPETGREDPKEDR